MELLIFKLKSGIKIKPSHKGLFTEYCKGKVTEECIRKGKNSSDPKIRKRATFASNIRKWKHTEGGKVFPKHMSVLDSCPGVVKADRKLLKKHLQGGNALLYLGIANIASNMISNGILAYLLKKDIDLASKLLEVQKQMNFDDAYNQALSLPSPDSINQAGMRSIATEKNNAYNQAKAMTAGMNNALDSRFKGWAALKKNEMRGLLANSIFSGISNIGQMALNNYVQSKFTSPEAKQQAEMKANIDK